MAKDYYLSDDDELDDGYSSSYEDDEDPDENQSDLTDEELDDIESEDDISSRSSIKSISSQSNLTTAELNLDLVYDQIVRISKETDSETLLSNLILSAVSANPKHNSAKTALDVSRDLLMKQGHNRVVNTRYVPEGPMTGEDVDNDYMDGSGEYGFNRQFMEEARELVSRFIGYLANRDLSKDDEFQKRTKKRHIPAFIIFLFSSGLYDLILNCPTLPPEYSEQVNNAFNKLMKSKYDLVEALAKRYEEKGRPEIAERVRKLQLAWFNKEPAEIRTATEYRDLDITYDDVVIYKEFRSKYTNVSKSITQEAVSPMIEVVVDADAGVYERLKDKTRTEAIVSVKQVWKDWVKENAGDSDLGRKILWRDMDSMKN